MIIVAFGGKTIEREGSILSASDVARALDRLKIYNLLVEDVTESQLKSYGSNVFICVHGEGGENGHISSLCEQIRVQYNFSSPSGHLATYDKTRFKNFLESKGIPTPRTLPFETLENVQVPVVVKPKTGGGSLGIRFVDPTQNNFHKGMLEGKYEPYYVEEFIHGKFATLAVTDFGESESASELLEVIFDGVIYSYEVKHQSSKHTYRYPGQFAKSTHDTAKAYALDVYRTLELKGAVRFDFIVEPSSKPCLIEANTIPGLSQGGNLAAIWKGQNHKYDDLIAELCSSII